MKRVRASVSRQVKQQTGKRLSVSLTDGPILYSRGVRRRDCVDKCRPGSRRSIVVTFRRPAPRLARPLALVVHRERVALLLTVGLLPQTPPTPKPERESTRVHWSRRGKQSTQ